MLRSPNYPQCSSASVKHRDVSLAGESPTGFSFAATGTRHAAIRARFVTVNSGAPASAVGIVSSIPAITDAVSRRATQPVFTVLAITPCCVDTISARPLADQRAWVKSDCGRISRIVKESVLDRAAIGARISNPESNRARLRLYDGTTVTASRHDGYENDCEGER